MTDKFMCSCCFGDADAAKAKIAAEKSQLEDEKAKLLAKVSELEFNKSTLENIVSRLESNTSILEKKVSHLESEKFKNVTRVSHLNSEKPTLEERVSELESDKFALETRVSLLESDKLKLETQVSHLESAKVTLEKKVSQVESNKSTLETRVSQLENEKGKLEAELRKSKAEIQGPNEEVAELKRLADGKRSHMIPARQLDIEWGDNCQNWIWKSLPDSMHGEVAELLGVTWFYVSGTIQTSSLIRGTSYSAYLIYKLNDNHEGFESPPPNAFIGLDNGDQSTRTVMLVANPERRLDGWMEIELGNYLVGENDGTLTMGLQEVGNGQWKTGLVVQGIEVRTR